MKQFFSFTFPEKTRYGMRSVGMLLGMAVLWGLSVLSASAQSSGNTITFDANHSTMLYSDLPNGTTAALYSCYLRHHQAPIQILNANPIGPSSGDAPYSIAPLQDLPGQGTGFFANSSLANNMAYSNDGRVQFYNLSRATQSLEGSPYKYICFAVIAPKGYRFTEYRMDIDGSQGNGTNGATIARYTYNNNSTVAYTLCSGESMDLTNAASGQIFSHTLSNAANILYFRVEVASASTQACVTMNEFRLKYVIEDQLTVSIPNGMDGTNIHTGYIDFGELTNYNTIGNNTRQYYFNKVNVTDLQEVKVVAEDNTATVNITNGAINVSKGGTYWIESPAKYRITGAEVTFKTMTVSGGYGDQSTTFTSGKTYLIGSGSGYMGRRAQGNTAASPTSNQTNQNNAERWTITQTSSGNYTIQNSAGNYLYLNNGQLGLISNLNNIPSGNYYSGEWSYNDQNRAFSATSGNRTYSIYYNNSWSLNRWGNSTSLYFYEVIESYTADNYTADVYNRENTGVAGSVSINSANGVTSGNVNLTDLDNDGIKFTVSGPAAFTVDLTLAPLDPTLQTLEFGYRLKDGTTDAGHYVSTNATNFKFNGGETIVLPIAPEDGGTAASHKVIFHNAINENRSEWYDRTGSGTKTSQYYLVGSRYDEEGIASTATDKTDANQAGTTKVPFSNLQNLTSSGGSLTETPFNKTNASYQDIVLQDNGAARDVYIYSADHPTHRIMTDAGKAENTHIAYTFYEASLKAVDIIEEPVITVTPIYTSTLKGDNVKVSAYNAAMGTSVSVAKDSDLDTSHVFYGVKVTSQPQSGSGTALGYLTCKDIVTAIKAELGNGNYQVYGGDVMRTVLYVDMSELNSVAGDFDDWKEIMLGTADNCLFFNPKGFSVSQDMIGGGLIAGGNGGTAVTDIVVNDQQPFFSPYEFYTSTHVARYFRTKVNGKDLPKNTTIVLPFSVLLSPEGYLRTASDNVDENVRFYNLTTELTPGIGDAWNVVTEPLTAASSVGAPLALAFKPYHLTSEEQTETTAFVVEATGATIPATPRAGADAFKNTDTDMVGYGSLNGVAIAKDEGIYYFSKEKFWNSSTLAAGKTVKVLPYRAYYKTNDATIKGLSEFGVDFDASVATGIKDIENDIAVKGVYDLTGRRVADDIQSLTRGIYIVNGKKYFVK